MTKQEAKLGTPVIYDGLKTQIISQQQERNGTTCVLVANVGDWVPIKELKKMKG